MGALRQVGISHFIENFIEKVFTLHPLFCFEILLHEATAFEVFVGHAHFAAFAFCVVDVIDASRNGNRSELAKGLAFQTPAAGVELLDLIPDHALQGVVIGDIERLDFDRMLADFLAERLHRKDRDVCPDIHNNSLVNQFASQLGGEPSERDEEFKECAIHWLVQRVNLGVVFGCAVGELDFDILSRFQPVAALPRLLLHW